MSEIIVEYGLGSHDWSILGTYVHLGAEFSIVCTCQILSWLSIRIHTLGRKPRLKKQNESCVSVFCLFTECLSPQWEAGFLKTFAVSEPYCLAYNSFIPVIVSDVLASKLEKPALFFFFFF